MKKILASIAFSLALAGPAAAQMKLQIGCTATSDCASAMVAVDEGIFKKHGLDVEMTPIGINSNIPAAIICVKAAITSMAKNANPNSPKLSRRSSHSRNVGWSRTIT